MSTLALLQVADAPTWVGPTMAISLAIIAVSILAAAIALAVAAFRVAGQVQKVGTMLAGLQDDAGQALSTVRRLTEQGQDLIVVLRNEAGAFAHTSRRMRRKLVRGADRIEAKLSDLETLYDLVHEEVEDTALDLTAALRSVRSRKGMLGRVRRLLVPGR
jgi:hypothetical protein